MVLRLPERSETELRPLVVRALDEDLAPLTFSVIKARRPVAVGRLFPTPLAP